MLAGRAIRHQMILPEQQYLFDYWRSKCRAGHMPHPADIDPADLAQHLPMISLLRIESGGDKPRFQYRLAGTGFWDIFEFEITGRFIDELPMGDTTLYWSRVLERVYNLKRPSAGVLKPKTPNKRHLAQFWIRLPLSEDGSNVTTILGFDHLVRHADMPQSVESGVRARA